MPISELISALAALGIDASQSQIRWCISSGKIAPPRKTSTGLFCFSDADVIAVAKILDDLAKRRARRREVLSRRSAKREAAGKGVERADLA